ncbi:MAG: PD40 domain-containing protein [Deltaproteobacteria bacterium]|nr:PD40 domain-containing protein [Deltaproteobacteria bacterium]
MSLLLALALASSAPTLDGQIYFVRESSGDPSVYRVRPDGQGLARVAEAPSFPYSASHDGRSIALVIDDRVMIASPDGRSRREVASGSARDGYPSFAPRRNEVIFESDRASFRALFLFDGTTATRLTFDEQGTFDGSFAPDGRSLVFSSSRAGRLDLYVAKLERDGGARLTNSRRLTNHPGDSVRGAFSADGEWIAFISGRDGRDDLFLVRPDGSDLTNLTRSAPIIAVEEFVWSPRRAELLAACRTHDLRSRIMLASPNQGLREWPNHGSEGQPSWSPNGERVAYVRSDGDRSDIHLARRDGSNPRPLVNPSLFRARADPLLGAGPAEPAASFWRPRWLNVKE